MAAHAAELSKYRLYSQLVFWQSLDLETVNCSSQLIIVKKWISEVNIVQEPRGQEMNKWSEGCLIWSDSVDQLPLHAYAPGMHRVILNQYRLRDLRRGVIVYDWIQVRVLMAAQAAELSKYRL